MSTDIARTSLSFLIAAAALTLFVAYSYLSPLALRTESPWTVSASRALAHFLPVLPPWIVALGLRQGRVWAWYVGLLYMAATFSLGLVLSFEHFAYLLHGHAILPVFLALSLLALPSLVLLLRDRRAVLHALRGAAR